MFCSAPRLLLGAWPTSLLYGRCLYFGNRHVILPGSAFSELKEQFYTDVCSLLCVVCCIVSLHEFNVGWLHAMASYEEFLSPPIISFCRHTTLPGYFVALKT